MPTFTFLTSALFVILNIDQRRLDWLWWHWIRGGSVDLAWSICIYTKSSVLHTCSCIHVDLMHFC